MIQQTSATDSTSPRTVTATCPAGKKPVGGGSVPNNSGLDIGVVYSAPDSAGTGWRGGFKENTATAGVWWGRTYVICVAVT